MADAFVKVSITDLFHEVVAENTRLRTKRKSDG